MPPPGNDAGFVWIDAGSVEADAGEARHDLGWDAGPVGSDAGPIAMDAGPPVAESDAGPMMTDAGTTPIDAGPPDAGSTTPDAGSGLGSAGALPPLDRSMYPDGSGDYAHMPRWQDWPVLYLLPPGSAFVPPSGARVHYANNRLNLDRHERYRIVCPEKFVNLRYGLRIQGGSWILSGYHAENTRMIQTPGTEGWDWYASNYEGGHRIPGPRPGRTKVISPTSAGRTRVTDDDENRGMYFTGHGSTGSRTFRAVEGAYFEGDWIFEGINVNFRSEAASTVFVLQHFRHDRVSVAYSRGYTGNNFKSGGDAFQVFDHGQPDELYILGMTVAASAIQGIFLKNPSGGTRTIDRLVIRDVVIRGNQGMWGNSGNLWWNETPVRNRTQRNIWIHRTVSPRRSSVDPTIGNTSGVTEADHADTIPASAVGLRYPFRFSPS